MHCPRCGAENQAGYRFCTGCGSALPDPARDRAAARSPRERIGNLIGTGRRTRLISAATAVLGLIAIAALIALKPDAGAIAGDSFTRGLDRTCVTEKGRIAALEGASLRRPGHGTEAFAAALVSVLAEWRFGLRQSHAPAVDAAGVRALDAALLEALIEAGGLARLARHDSGAPAIAAQARAVDTAGANVDRAIAELGLARCADLAVAPTAGTKR